MAVPQEDDGEVLVFYEVCISLVFVTLRRPTRVHRLAAGESGTWRGLPYALVTLLLGWWGLPWGLLYTPLVLWTNLSGGCEVVEAAAANTCDAMQTGPQSARSPTEGLTDER